MLYIRGVCCGRGCVGVFLLVWQEHTSSTKKPAVAHDTYAGFLFDMSLNRQVWISVSDIEGMSLKRKKTLAFLLKVKSAFKNSLVYDYTAKSLAKKLKLSEYQVRKHVKALRDMDMCYNEGANLRFRSIRKKFGKFNRRKIKVTGRDSINTVVEKMDFLVISNMVKSQFYLVEIKPNLKKPKLKSTWREGMIDNTFVGMRKLGQKLGVSPIQAWRVVKSLKAKNLIQAEEYTEELTEDWKRELERRLRYGSRGSKYRTEGYKLQPGHVFIHKGHEYIHHGTKITLVEKSSTVS